MRGSVVAGALPATQPIRHESTFLREALLT